MFCRNCGKEVGSGAAVCIYCGSAIGSGASFCAGCGSSTAPNAVVCVKCGASLHASGAGDFSSTKPGKVQAIAIIHLVSGILNVVAGLVNVLVFLYLGFFTFGLSCLFLILTPVPVIFGILEILYATKLLADPIKISQPKTYISILEICSVLWCGVLQLTAGIITMVFYNDPEVKAYFASRRL